MNLAKSIVRQNRSVILCVIQELECSQLKPLRVRLITSSPSYFFSSSLNGNKTTVSCLDHWDCSLNDSLKDNGGVTKTAGWKKQNEIIIKNFKVPFYEWCLTASRLHPFSGGSLIYNTKSPKIPGTHFINLRRV